ncbi:hypothetical protein BH23GEM9_BH23GEM9_07290 [soil metagenome]
MRHRAAPLVLVLACTTATAIPAHAQRPAGPPTPADTANAFADTHAAALMNRARQARQSSDASLRSYTAIVQSRMAAGLRMPMKDRTIVRLESAARVRWSRDGENLVEVLAGRAQTPGGVEPAPDPMIRPFDPRQDRLYFGMMRDSARAGRGASQGDDDDFYIEHPLGEHAERHYRYRSGDTVVIRLQDGQSLRVAELLVMPRRNDPQTVRGTLWVEIGSAAVVRAAFRLARRVDIVHDMNTVDEDDRAAVSKVPFINPLEFDLSLMTIEYGLWDMTHWLPRSMRLEGMARAGVFVAPAAFEVNYRIQEVITDRDDVHQSEAELIAQTLAEWQADGDYVSSMQGRRGNRSRVLRPRDADVLLQSELLPPPIWENAPGFATESELREIYERIAAVQGPPRPDLPVRFGWGLGEPGMLRYNRVEALSIGARVTAPLPHVTLVLTGRIGGGDLHPNADLLVTRETMRRTLELRAYHELATAEPNRRAFGAGNSLSAALLGRDEGEYYRATGAAISVAPPRSRRHWWDVRAYAEMQDSVTRNTHVALPRLWDREVFRPNISAAEATQYGALLHLRPWWGTDPFRAQFGLDMLVQGEAGDYEHVRGRLILRGAAPLAAGIRIGAEAGIGSSEGDVPVQRYFFLGGASTLRGYEPGSARGTSMARGRLELARAQSFGNLAVFTDWGWAGDRTEVRRDDQRWALGAGISLLDGLVRLDLAHGMREPRRWRLDLHVDAVL